MSAIAVVKRNEILAKVAEGEHLKAIATELGITPAAISQQLSHDPEYKKAREAGAEIRLEDQYEKMASADDPLKLARAREGFRAAAWFAEREFPARWGNKQQITAPDGSALSFNQITINFQSPEKQGRVIDAEQQSQCNIVEQKRE